MLRSLLIICCFVLSVSIVCAQSVFSGRVLENKTRITLRGVRIENLNNKLKAITGSDGTFSIGAKAGDIITFKTFAYQTDTLLLTDMHDREVFMLPQTNTLNQVTITDSSGRTGNADKNAKLPFDPQFHGQAIVAHRDINGDFDGGITLRLHYFNKDERRKRKAAELEKDREIVEQIITVFTPTNISTYVPLRGKDLNDFILLYAPDVKVYKSKDFYLLTYLNASYKNWLTLTPQQRKDGQLIKE